MDKKHIDLKLFDAEYRFMDIIWDNEPINSTELTKLCLDILGWKKSTTYTMLKRLSQRNIVVNENAIVKSLVDKMEIQRYESNAVLDKTFGGSLPSFINAFLDGKTIDREEAEKIKKMIEEAVK